MRALALLLPLMAAACDNPPQPTADQIDYDAINETARGPGHPIEPEPIASSEATKAARFKCVFSIDRESDILFIATPGIAIMRLGDEDIQFSPVPSANPLPHDISDRFDGRAYRVEVTVDKETETQVGPGLSRFNGKMSVSDEHRRVVYNKSGQIECSINGQPVL